MNDFCNFVQAFCQNLIFVSETKFSVLAVGGGKHKGSAFVDGQYCYMLDFSEKLCYYNVKAFRLLHFFCAELLR